jgi:CHRD domain-containing protein
MRRKAIVAALLGAAVLVALAISAFAMAKDGGPKIEARHGGLSGFQEVPVLSTSGHGTFEARINKDDTAFDWTLTYGDLVGNVTQSHIHFGQPGVNGGISIWLCGTAALPGPAGTAPCPTPGGTVTGTASAATVVGPSGQGIAAGEFAEILAAIRAGKAYANVHSTTYPGGEIRAQLSGGGHRGRDH